MVIANSTEAYMYSIDDNVTMSVTSIISKILPSVYKSKSHMTVNDHKQFLQHQLPMSLIGPVSK